MKIFRTKTPEKFTPYTISIQVETNQEEGSLKDLFYILNSFIERQSLGYGSHWNEKELSLFKKIHEIVVEAIP